MNVVREINKINERELDFGTTGSWHDDYKDSAYIFIGGLNTELTEGDVITIFSQYGEIMDVNMPRDKTTGKPRGFAFVMYEDQRSTVLAVDNLNGAKVLERTLRVDHVKDYKQQKVKGEDGELADREEQSLNAKPELLIDNGGASESSDDSGPEIDPEDPMREYLLAQRKERKALKQVKKPKDKRKDETPEERKARKQRKKEKKAKKEKKSEGMRAVENLLKELEGRDSDRMGHSPSPRHRGRSRSRERRRDTRMDVDVDPKPTQRRSLEDSIPRSRSRSPPRSPVPRHTGRPVSRSRSPPGPSRDKRARRSEESDDLRRRRYAESPPRRRMEYD